MSQDSHATEKLEQLDEFCKLELTQVVERIQSLVDFRVQIGVFFGTATVTALGLGFTIEQAGGFFFATLIAIACILTDMRTHVSRAVYYRRGLQLHKRYAPNDNETFLRILLGHLIWRVREAAELETPEKRQAALKRLPFPSPRSVASGCLAQSHFLKRLLASFFGSDSIGLCSSSSTSNMNEPSESMEDGTRCAVFSRVHDPVERNTGIRFGSITRKGGGCE